MDQAWRRWLEDAGAALEDGRVVHYGNPDLERRVALTGAVLADLGHWGVLRARGADAASFLQGQLTADLREVEAGRSRLAAHCTPQGRVRALYRVLAREDEGACGELLLFLPEDLLEQALAALRRYVLMARVELEPAGEAWVRLGYADPQGEARLARALEAEPEALPREADGVARVPGPEGQGVTVVRLHGPRPRFLLLGERPAMERLWERLDVHAAPVGAPAWELLEVLAGEPQVYPQTTELFLPQMLNLDLLGGVSFSKGCYTGQEVVARTRHLGRLKRRMRRLRCPGRDEPPPPGAALHSPAWRADEAAGTVVRAASDPDGGCELLAVIPHELAGAPLHLEGPQGPACELLPLPYPLPEGP
ncbi:MAG: folate-binding protein [Gammaproteobacteria bacterium]|nr:MAG: folate-binding protein [Gammaproteobacteria bacterium]